MYLLKASNEIMYAALFIMSLDRSIQILALYVCAYRLETLAFEWTNNQPFQI